MSMIMTILAVQAKLQSTIGGIFGLQACMTRAKDALSLSNEQIEAFCDATPDGEELWRMFTGRRDARGAAENYNFMNFVVEILATTGHPVVTVPAASQN